jgi:hypothetical protein
VTSNGMIGLVAGDRVDFSRRRFLRTQLTRTPVRGQLHERPGRLTSGCRAGPVTSKLTERVVDALADFYSKNPKH